jgi:flagellar protein FlaG
VAGGKIILKDFSGGADKSSIKTSSFFLGDRIMAINPTQGVTQTQTVVWGGPTSTDKQASGPAVQMVSTSKVAQSSDPSKQVAAQQEQRVKEAAQQLNEFMKITSIGLHFTTDWESGQTVVKVLNKATGEVIRQIPSEEALKLSKAMDTLQGLIIRQKV